MEKQKKDVFFALVWKNLFLFWMIFELPSPSSSRPLQHYKH